MELVTAQYEVQRVGLEEIVLQAGDVLKIETNLVGGGGTELLVYTVPTGRADNIRIKVNVNEEPEQGGA